MSKTAYSQNSLLNLRKAKSDRPAAERPTVGGQMEILLKMVPSLLGEIEECDQDIEDRGDAFEFEGDNPIATAALEAVLDLPTVPARLARLPVRCLRLDWDGLRNCAKAVGDQLEAIQEAIGDRRAGEFGEALEDALGWFNEF